MFADLLAVNITTAVVVGSAAAIGAVFFIVLFLRPSGRWTTRATLSILSGVLVGILVCWLVTDVFDVFGIDFTYTTVFWFAALLGSLALAVLSFRRSPRWRKATAAISIPVFTVVAGLGINAEFGLNRTPGALLGISTAKDIDLAQSVDPNAPTPPGPLWERWSPSANLAATGQQGKTAIPATASGFVARDAGIYLPPAAQGHDAPQLPLVVLLMGQPGNPDPADVAAVLDKFAAKNRGLAPIVIVADQIGPGQDDTLCVDSSRYGNVETYLMKDVLEYAKTHLRILKDPKYWTIAGYSNGGQCAISLGAKHPDVFGNILDISGEEYPGAEAPGANLANIFHGDQAAYDAQKPVNIMSKTKFKDTTAVFTAGANDRGYVEAARIVSGAAAKAGMATTFYEVPNAGHLEDALLGGLEKGFEILYPRLGLSR
ncbi:alpha/beta hydrolase-fold protein [Paenarthrobacter nicotinovorans]|uniref:Alpha/beta hydrolase-fold protein n=1 Tax=Paenarthrobacter nicotinovorans TaxID=29320 RepID=A0ABV0GM64_PAENI